MTMSARYFKKWPERLAGLDPQCLGVRGHQERCQNKAEGQLVDAKMRSYGGYCQHCGERMIALAAQRRGLVRAS